MPIAIQIGERRYASRAAAAREIRPILHDSPLGTPLSGEPGRLIRDLLDLHPDVENKIRPGVQHIEVRETGLPGHPPTRGFWIIHPSGQATDFSYRVCLDPRRFEQRFEEAARLAVLESQRAVKEKHFRGLSVAACQDCRRPMMPADATVHHRHPLPFREIAARYQRALDEVGIVPLYRPRAPYGIEFVDPDLQAAWVEYHDLVADRSVVCRTCNAAAERHSPPYPTPMIGEDSHV